MNLNFHASSAEYALEVSFWPLKYVKLVDNCIRKGYLKLKAWFICNIWVLINNRIKYALPNVLLLGLNNMQAKENSYAFMNAIFMTEFL